MKRIFPCGHKGKGQYCHRCKTASEERARRQEDRSHKLEMERLLGAPSNQIPLKVLRKAAAIKRRFDETGTLDGIKGRRMVADPSLFSVHVTYSYRMLFRKSNGRLVYESTISHEDYNNIVTT
jgi:hypothetical protein